MAYGVSTTGFAHIESYDSARKHFDSVKPWRSKFNRGGEERPIGVRAVKASDGYHFNKAMRMLDDESIAFRLFATDCVIWHPDGTLSVEGYPSISTSTFIGMLTPSGVAHSFRGRSDPFDPILHLTSIIRHDSSWGGYDGPDWDGGEIILCERGVHLHYNAKLKRWEPVDHSDLDTFEVPTINRRHAREVSREYNLPTLQKVMNAVMALAKPPVPLAPWARGSVRFGEIMAALKREDYMHAVALLPRSTGSSRTQAFGHRPRPAGELLPNALQLVRDHIYDHEGVIERVWKSSLTPAQYKRYVRDSGRFY